MRDNRKGKKSRTLMAFRDETAKRRILEAISERREHSDLSETLREATDEYIERHRDLLLKAA
jgi:hypothetical protein